MDSVKLKRLFFLAATVAIGFALPLLAAEQEVQFEGRMSAEIQQQGGASTFLLYTVGAGFLRIEVTGSDSDQSGGGGPNPINLVSLESGDCMIIFPHNRSFVRLKSAARGGAALASRGMPKMPTLPPGVGPQLPGILSRGSTALPGPQMPVIPTGAAMPSGPAAGMPPMPMLAQGREEMKLKATGRKKRLSGIDCEQYEINYRGETMEIYATDQLPRFHAYVRSQSPRLGPPALQEQWAELLAARKLFPLRATLRLDDGGERFRFEVKAVKREKVEQPELFRSPEGYTEVRPLPF